MCALYISQIEPDSAYKEKQWSSVPCLPTSWSFFLGTGTYKAFQLFLCMLLPYSQITWSYCISQSINFGHFLLTSRYGRPQLSSLNKFSTFFLPIPQCGYVTIFGLVNTQRLYHKPVNFTYSMVNVWCVRTIFLIVNIFSWDLSLPLFFFFSSVFTCPYKFILNVSNRVLILFSRWSHKSGDLSSPLSPWWHPSGSPSTLDQLPSRSGAQLLACAFSYPSSGLGPHLPLVIYSLILWKHPPAASWNSWSQG